VIIDRHLNQPGEGFQILYSNQANPRSPQPAFDKSFGNVQIHEIDGAIGRGPARSLRVDLGPMEVQILGKG
jgi:hypothetical protein